MPSYLQPGVFWEELQADPSWITGEPSAATDLAVRSRWTAPRGVAAFLGLTERGPYQVPVLVDGVDGFARTFGGSPQGGMMDAAVRGFFVNGGRSCYVVRVGAALADRDSARELLDGLVGDGGERTGLYALETLSDISLVALPDVMPAHAAGVLDSQSASAAQMAAVVHCELLGDRVAILDAPRGTSAQQIYEWRQTRHLDTAYAALYWPWVLVETPGARILAPPSGHIAGVLARLDLQVGPHRSSLQELVRGAVDVEVRGSSSERDLLNPAGINVLAPGPTKPVAVGGARTLTDSRPEFRMLHDRRLLNFIADNVVERTEWALAARADEREVWRQLAHDVASFLELLWRGGALAGATAAEAYAVRCDDLTNGGEGQRAIRLHGMVSLPTGGPVAFRIVWNLG